MTRSFGRVRGSRLSFIVWVLDLSRTLSCERSIQHVRLPLLSDKTPTDKKRLFGREGKAILERQGKERKQQVVSSLTTDLNGRPKREDASRRLCTSRASQAFLRATDGRREGCAVQDERAGRVCIDLLCCGQQSTISSHHTQQHSRQMDPVNRCVLLLLQMIAVAV